jgi:hypothetical protein
MNDATRSAQMETSISSRGTYVIQDPYHEYGQQFISHIYSRFGYRALCLYTDRRERRCYGRESQRAGRAAIADEYDFDPEHVDDLVKRMTSRHKVLGIIPFNETSVVLAAELAERIGLRWGQPVVMRRFRDKYSFKQHQREARHGVRINASLRVTTFREIMAAKDSTDFRQFILKPNDGYGNRQIGKFDQVSTVRQIEDYLSSVAGTDLVMEEYVGGTEYFVNGQVDGVGNVTTIAIFEYRRGVANGRHNIDLETTLVRHESSMFEPLAQYARQIIVTSGLKRSPFHLEIKVDERGPCLIEAAARLAGHGNALLSGALHGPDLSTIALAAHYYFTDEPFGEVPLDWPSYDADSIRYVHGVAGKQERILDLEGVTAVEALPEFYGWVKKPVTGMRAERTVDALSMPWSLILYGANDALTSTAAGEVRRLLCWNQRMGIAKRVLLNIRYGTPRLLKRIIQTIAGFWSHSSFRCGSPKIGGVQQAALGAFLSTELELAVRR